MTKPNNPTQQQLLLLASSEEAYSAAASVLQPAIKDMIELYVKWPPDPNASEEFHRLNTGLHLLEDAMAAHNRYMDSIK